MKVIAALLFCLFSLFQAGPVISLLFSEEPAIVIIDEEKHNDHPKPENKLKKDFSGFPAQLVLFSGKLVSHFNPNEQLQPSPCLERPTPPPNYC